MNKAEERAQIPKEYRVTDKMYKEYLESIGKLKHFNYSVFEHFNPS